MGMGRRDVDAAGGGQTEGRESEQRDPHVRGAVAVWRRAERGRRKEQGR